MGDLHFSNWVRLVVFTFDRITEFTICELRFTNEEGSALVAKMKRSPFADPPSPRLRRTGLRVRRATPCPPQLGPGADHRLTLGT